MAAGLGRLKMYQILKAGLGTPGSPVTITAENITAAIESLRDMLGEQLVPPPHYVQLDGMETPMRMEALILLYRNRPHSLDPRTVRALDALVEGLS
jgi:hypothetical protein